MFCALQDKAIEIYERYGFRARKKDLIRVLDAEVSSIWEMLEDTLRERMRGYGPMDPDTAVTLKRDIRELLAMNRRIRAYLLREEEKQQDNK